MILLALNLLHYSRSVLEADLVCSSHFSGGSIAYAVEDFVEHMRRMDLSANTFYRRVREYEAEHGIAEQTSACYIAI